MREQHRGWCGGLLGARRVLTVTPGHAHSPMPPLRFRELQIWAGQN